jgi:signal transduction histidine kinase/CheY-like chemotaxis protein
MNVFALSGLSVGISCLILSSIAVYFGKTKLHRLLLLFNVAVAVWGFGLFFVGIADTGQKAIVGWQIAHFGGFFIAPSYFHMISIFCGIDRRKLIYFAYSQAVFFAFIGLGTKLIFNNVRFVYDIYYYKANLIYISGVLFYIFFVLLSYYELLKLLPHTKGYKRTQTLYIIFGFLFGFLGGSSTFLPMFQIDAVYPFGNFGITLYVFILAYAILRHRLMDIHLIFKRTVVYSLSAGLLTGLLIVLVITLSGYFSDIVGISSFTITVSAALIIALLFNPLKNMIQSMVDKVFYKTTYDYYEAIQKISHELISTMNLKKSYRLIVDTLLGILKLKSAYLLLKGKKNYETVYFRTAKDTTTFEDNETALSLIQNDARVGVGEEKYRTFLDKNSELVKLLQEKGIIIKEELPILLNNDRTRSIEQELFPYKGEIAVPIIIENEISLLLILGEKLSGDMFSDEDINLLKTVASQAAIAIKNARLYDELEERIAERTEAVKQLEYEISERKKLEDQLLQSQKVEAIGQLAGGVAHDFNNILNVIIGYGNLMQMKIKKDDPLRMNIDQILTSADRATHLIQSLLAFSRKQIINLQPINLNEVVSKVEKLLLRVIGEDIKLKTICAEEDLTVMADSVYIEQVLMNLATNARDSMSEGGMLVIETGVEEISEEYSKTHEYEKPGKYAHISVIDSGHGFDEKTKEKIFEPFFTTKEVGKGTGLGLSMVYGIIKQHNGSIDVYSEPGMGTKIKIYLPEIEAEVKEEAKIEPASVRGGTETVLVAEDDAAVRRLTIEILKRFGYTVTDARDGEEAIDKFKEKEIEIDLLLLDVIMPKKNGKAVYEEIRKINPDIKVLFLSGYTENLIHKKGILEEGLNFIFKPVTINKLLKNVRDVLDK